jgi:hypothetical protein
MDSFGFSPFATHAHVLAAGLGSSATLALDARLRQSMLLGVGDLGFGITPNHTRRHVPHPFREFAVESGGPTVIIFRPGKRATLHLFAHETVRSADTIKQLFFVYETLVRFVDGHGYPPCVRATATARPPVSRGRLGADSERACC